MERVQTRGKLRRSASIASLPTPPRTQHKRKRGRSRLSNASTDSDEGSMRGPESSGDDACDAKRRRTRSPDAEADAFWLGPSAKAVKDSPIFEPQSPAQDQSADGEEAPLALINFRKRTSAKAAESSLVSPPPSLRKSRIAGGTPTAQSSGGTLSSTATSPPQTPPARTSSKKSPSDRPIRDSPSNPFLDSPLRSDEEFASESSPPTGASEPWDEKPTVTMVFRGARKVFANPNYDAEKGRGKSPDPNSLLDVEHPDYEADFRSKPRVLFPKRKKVERKTSSKKYHNEGESDKAPSTAKHVHELRTSVRKQSPSPPSFITPGAGAPVPVGLGEQDMGVYMDSMQLSFVGAAGSSPF